jgi:chemotaxis signal transduction protein
MSSGCGNPLAAEHDGANLISSELADARGIGKRTTSTERLREKQSGTTGIPTGPKQWFCLFRGDAGPMAVSLEFVAEILETDTLVRLPWSPPQVVGLCSHHREVVPVVALRPLDRDAGDDPTSADAQAAPAGRDTERVRCDDPSRRVVLILKTEHGAWGARVEAGNPIMSRESASYNSPRESTSGAVLIGVIRHEAISYRILDPEATWRRVRSEVGRWAGLINESNLPSLPSGADPVFAALGVSGDDRKA